MAPPSAREGSSGVFEERLPLTVFQVLLAIGWADGRLDDDERDAVLAAAAVEGLDSAQLASLRESAAERVELDSIDVSRLRAHARQYVYAVARWIALLDGELTDREAAALRILGFVLRMPVVHQVEIDTIVREIIDTVPGRDMRAMILSLRDAVRSRLRVEVELAR